MGIVYPIDKVEPDVSIGEGKYLVWKLNVEIAVIIDG